jgi:carboxyl-terminal processing protease
MSFRTKFFLVVLSAVIATYAVVGGMLTNWSSRAQQPINDAGAQIRIFESVLQHIQNDYVDEPNMEKVRGGALRGLAYGLDPYSSYLTADQVKDYQSAKTSNKVGIGAELSQVASYLYVIAPIKGSPAEKAGVQAGDVIEYIEDKATRDISLYDAQQLLRGEAGSKVKVRVLRSGSKPQTIEITRGTYKIPESESRLEQNGKIGIIKVYSLETDEAADIKNHLNNLMKQGAQKIVLDLRGVAAGNINEAVEVANLFIKDGNLAQTIGRENKVLKTFTADPSKHVFGGQMAVLIDIATSAAAEVLAGAILDRGRGDVLGERSFGAGTEQQLFTLKSGDGLLLTTVKWASPNGKPFLNDERKTSGVMPNIEVKRPETPEPLDPEELDNEEPQPRPDSTPEVQPSPTPKPQVEDVQLKKALEVLRGENTETKPKAE